MAKKLSSARASAVREFVYLAKIYCKYIDTHYDLDRLADDYINRRHMNSDDYIVDNTAETFEKIGRFRRFLNFLMFRWF